MSTEGAGEAIRYYSEALKLKEGLGQDDLVLRLNLAVAKVVKKYLPDAFYIHSGEDIKYGTPVFTRLCEAKSRRCRVHRKGLSTTTNATAARMNGLARKTSPP